MQNLQTEKVVRPIENELDPWRAAFLSFILTGLGQIYSGKIRKGLILLAANTFVVVLLAMKFSREGINFVTFYSAIFVVFGFWFYSILDAFFLARKALDPNKANAFAGRRNPNLSAFVSFLLPGVGQAYNGSILTALLFIIASSAASYFSDTFLLGPFIPPLIKLLSAVHAYEDSLKKNGEKIKYPSFSGWFLGLILVGLFFIHVLPYQNVFEKYIFTSGMETGEYMAPAIVPNDFVSVDRAYYGISIPELGLEIKKGREVARGDVVVAKMAGEKSGPVILRVIGLPGDRVSIKDKKIFLNGVKLDEPYVLFRETRVLPAQNGKKSVFGDRDNFGPAEIPAGSYFLLGDNRDISIDSRFDGVVLRENIFGKVTEKSNTKELSVVIK